MPKTPGETLNGRHIVLADEVHGRAAVIVAGFSRQGGNGSGTWVRAIRADKALAGLSVYEIAELVRNSHQEAETANILCTAFIV